MKSALLLPVVLILTLGILASCKETEDDIDVSVPSASSLSTYSGTLPANDATGQAQAVTALAGIVSSIDSDLGLSVINAKKAKALAKAKGFSDSYSESINYTYGNLTVTGTESFSIRSNLDEEQLDLSPSQLPAGSYMQFGVGVDLTGKMAEAGYTAVVSSDTYTVHGQFGIKMNGTIKTTIVAYPTMSASYSIEVGFGFGLSVSNAAGMGGKFILTFSYANAESATYNYTTGAGLDYSSTPANLTVTLKVYDNANKLHASYTLTTAQIEALLPGIIDDMMES